MTEGWIKVHRKILDSAVFQNEYLLKLWIYCLVRANHKEVSVSIKTGKGNTIVKLMPGQFIYGQISVSRDLNWPRRTTHDRLKKLERLGNLATQSTPHYTIVSICNWESYQEIENTINDVFRQPTANQPPTNRQPTATDKNDKNDKNIREGGNNSEISAHENGQYPPSLELIKIPVSEREDVIARQIKPLNMSKEQQEIYMSKIGAVSYNVPRSGMKIPLTVESVYHDAKHHLVQGYLEPKKKTDTSESSIRNYMIV
jgi:hypothetical protein